MQPHTVENGFLHALPTGSSSPTGRWARCCRPRIWCSTTSRASRAATRSSTTRGPTWSRDIHRAYFAAGADAVETNTFGANLPNLAEYGIPDADPRARREGHACWPARWPTRCRRRTGRGSCSARSAPARSCRRWATSRFARLRDAYAECGRGLVAGGADAIVVETCQDLLQAKAAILGVRRAMAAEGRRGADRGAGGRRDHRHDAARLARSAPRSPRWRRSASTSSG